MERSLGVKAPWESKVESPCRGTGGVTERVEEHPTECHIFSFVEMKVFKLFFVISQIYVQVRA